jgi:hypothetical protein
MTSWAWLAAIAPTPPALRLRIEAAIADSRPAWLAVRRANRADLSDARSPSLGLKYVPGRFTDTYRTPNGGLFIGASHYTWGTRVYVVGVAEPLSTALYGRVGVVSSFTGSRWRAFDARDAANQALYLEWLKTQPVFDDALLSVHTDPLLHLLRNAFREQFTIDVVLFPPDEGDFGALYTKPTDTWMAVSDWSRGKLRTGFSRRFTTARAVVILEEAFVEDRQGLVRLPALKIGGAGFTPSLAAHVVRDAYAAGGFVRVLS